MFDPATREVDLIALTVQVFLPLAFALVLLILPSRFREAMRWWALVGATATLTLAACRFVDYYALLETYSDRNLSSLYHPATRLEARSDQAFADANAMPLPKPYRSDDLLARRPWVSVFNVDFALGIDGLSLAFLLVTSVVAALAVVASWPVTENLRGHLALILLLQTCVSGALLSLDLFLFIVFVEAAALPAFLLLNLWGTRTGRAAATRFAWTWLLGGVSLSLAVLILYSFNVRDFADPGVVAAKAADLRQRNPALSEADSLARVQVRSFDFVTLGKASRAVMLVLTGREDRIAVRPAAGEPPVPTGHAALFSPGVNREAALAEFKKSPICSRGIQGFLFFLLVKAFAFKLGLLPWQRTTADTHSATTPAVSMLLAGLLVPLAGYGLVRLVVPLVPFAADEWGWIAAALACVAAVWATIAAAGQTDLKRLLAYASVAQMSLVAVGVLAWGSSADDYQLALGGPCTCCSRTPSVSPDCSPCPASSSRGSATLTWPASVACGSRCRCSPASVRSTFGPRPPCPASAPSSASSTSSPASAAGSVPAAGVALVVAFALSLVLLRAWQRLFLGAKPQAADTPDVDPREFTLLTLLAGLSLFLGVAPMLVFVWLDPSIIAQVDALGVLK